MKKSLKVFVGMSGGVDSSVSAALLKEAGYDVTGVFIKVWQADFLPCTWREERRDAMRAAAHLGIPFMTLDLEKEYKEGVVDYMIREYAAGRVPNPDVMCNKHVKFGAFLEFARRNGADRIATGHYARIEESAGRYRLLKGIDHEKDQSYFLWTLRRETLPSIIFPVGGMKKSEVRELAKKYGLPNAEKKDSQGLCFMGPVNMKDFLKHYLKTEEGNVIDEGGNVIGRHDGAMLYTIGQRHGFSTAKRTALEEPYYVIGKDIEKNTLTVSHRDPLSASTSLKTFGLEDVNLFDAEACGDPKSLKAQIRYRGELFPLEKTERTGDRVRITLEAAIDGVTSGQSAAIYRDAELVLAGVIA